MCHVNNKFYANVYFALHSNSFFCPISLRHEPNGGGPRKTPNMNPTLQHQWGKNKKTGKRNKVAQDSILRCRACICVNWYLASEAVHKFKFHYMPLHCIIVYRISRADVALESSIRQSQKRHSQHSWLISVLIYLKIFEFKFILISLHTNWRYRRHRRHRRRTMIANMQFLLLMKCSRGTQLIINRWAVCWKTNNSRELQPANSS